MTPAEAAALLELSPDATAEQIETRFLDLRVKLEEKIGKAPTPGLKDKYRRSLEEITTAFETLTLAADSSTLPVLKRAATPTTAGANASAPISGNAAQASRPDTAHASPSPAPSKKKTGGNKEFVLVAAIAVALLGGGGWFVLKMRAENEEKSRLGAEAKATAERVASEAKAEAEKQVIIARQKAEEEKAHQENQLAGLRAKLAEARVAWETFPAEVQACDRRLSELKSDARNTDKMTGPQRAELAAQLAAQQAYSEWLTPFVQRHPVKTLLAKLDALTSARALDEAAKTAEELKGTLATADKELAAQKTVLLAITTELKTESTPAGAKVEISTAYGGILNGATPVGGQVPLGRTVVTVTLPGHPPQTFTEYLRAGKTSVVSAKFAVGALSLTSEPSGAEVWLAGKKLGVTPCTVESLPVGEVTLSYAKSGYLNTTLPASVVEGKTGEFRANLVTAPGSVAGIPLVYIAPGTFIMGDSNDGPPHQVTLTKGYCLGKTEVTQAQYESVTGANPSETKGVELPVEKVSWEDAMVFCRKLTAREREAGRLPEGYVYTLPTAAQWEYACRAGTTGDYSGTEDLDTMGWYEINSNGSTHPVGQKRPNAWGLYDMHGNVCEWCSDWIGPYSSGSTNDPIGPESGSQRVIRGGSRLLRAEYCRSAKKSSWSPDARVNIIGFRLALSPE